MMIAFTNFSVCPNFVQPILSAIMLRSSLSVRFFPLSPILDVSRVDAIYLFAHSLGCGLAHGIPPCCSHRPSALLALDRWDVHPIFRFVAMRLGPARGFSFEYSQSK